jgi:geranylgeranyl reductase family protein
MIMTDYDVIVVGGGPAGSTTARRVAQAGQSVLLLDEAMFPRNKPCAGGARFMVSDILDFDLTSVTERKISGLSMFAPSGFRVDCIPEDRSKPGITVMREAFDHLLLQKASEAGADVKESSKVTHAIEDFDSVTVTTQDGSEYKSHFLVGADGVNSTVAKQLGFYDGWKGDSASVALEVEAEIGKKKVREICGEQGYEAELILLYFGDHAHGYDWVFPKESILSVGACCRQDKVNDLRGKFENWFAGFKEEYEIEPKILSDDAARFPVKEAKTLVKGRILLVGDAAGFVDAFTGEGIPEAIHSGILAASSLSMAVEKANPNTLKGYEKDVKRHILSELKVSQSMAKLFYRSTKNMETLCRFFRDDSYASFLIAASIGGLLPQKVVKRKMTLRMMRTRPRDALSLYM